MTDDHALDRLRAAGFTVDSLTPEQLEVLGALSPHELDVLEDIKGRLDEAEPEVRAHSEFAGGALF
ncbi:MULTISPECIES: aroma-sacti cluster domain-containing protein [unclassified Streptomyces]|uniref:aroma-sacti cluster domain-containing protein n=1 Tax=unclassified Streptomyces TaxID=2593676 RepID=UPI00344F7983